MAGVYRLNVAMRPYTRNGRYRIFRRSAAPIEPFAGAALYRPLSRTSRRRVAANRHAADRRADARTRLQGKAIFSLPLRQTIKKLEAAGISAPDGLAYLAYELLSCGVIVHQGSAGMAMAGIAADIPHVMIRTDAARAGPACPCPRIARCLRLPLVITAIRRKHRT
ncbi:hypothetical protein [Taklimakanibacter deserti]|uniref:hypothetical protein n=1 Tax=Taklimakanibacter deserti TaxID=2267839 RepID=UPI0013C44CE5